MFKKMLLGFLAVVVSGSFMLCFSADENVWLHVEGRYIKAADGGAFVPAGGAYIASDTISGNPEEILSWCKKLKINTIRISMREEQASKDIDAYLAKYVDPVIEACKLYGIYAILDSHNYFHEYNPEDTWMPRGAVWGKDRVQKWVDNWVKIANRYKDEPWVMGYELMNEPYDMDAGQVRDYYGQAIKAIREIDKKHIIILGTNNFTHIENVDETWGKVKFAPDAPYNQVVFAFHEYTNSHNPPDFTSVLDKILKKYNVPMLCTEFGSDTVTEEPPTLEEKRQFQKDMFDALKQRQVGWLIWRLQGAYPAIKCDYEDIWQPALADATPTSVVIKGSIDCGASARNVVADNKSEAVITATLKGTDGKVLATADDSVKFVVKGEAVITGENPAKAVNGIATVKVKFNKTGISTILVLAKGYYNGKIDIAGKPDKASKVICKAEPASIPADGSSKSKITACIADAFGNVVDNSAVYRVNCGGAEYIDSKGRLWLADQTYADGSWGYTVAAGIYDGKAETVFKGTDDSALYNTNRGMSATEGYRFTLPNGKYNVELLFAETWFGVKSKTPPKGARVYDIMIENEAKVKDLDVFDKVGAMTAYSETVNAEVKDGVLDIFVNNKADSCEIRAISVTPETPVTDKFTFTATGAGSIEGINPVEPVGGKAVVSLKAGAEKVTAAFPGLTPGTVDVTMGK